MGRPLGVPDSQFLLDGDGALHRLHHTGKLRQQVIPRGVHDPPPVLLDEAGHHLPIAGYGADGRHLVLAHETAIPLDIGAEDRRKPAFHAHMLPELMVACLPDPEGSLTAERVEEWRGNWNEALLCGCEQYSSCSRSRVLMIDRNMACVESVTEQPRYVLPQDARGQLLAEQLNSPYYEAALFRHFPALPPAQAVFEVPLHDIEQLAGDLRDVLRSQVQHQRHHVLGHQHLRSVGGAHGGS